VPRDRASFGIGREGARRSAKNIPGHLIEENAERQRAVRSVFPVVEAASDGIGVKASEPLANQFVEVGRSVEPISAVCRIKPEFQNVARHLHKSVTCHNF
jgi:hypothetical protein